MVEMKGSIPMYPTKPEIYEISLFDHPPSMGESAANGTVPTAPEPQAGPSRSPHLHATSNGTGDYIEIPSTGELLARHPRIVRSHDQAPNSTPIVVDSSWLDTPCLSPSKGLRRRIVSSFPPTSRHRSRTRIQRVGLIG